jgi:iron complex transport system substrate-binding protein
MAPQRIVCLTAETTEIAFAVGAGERVVGVSGYAVRPPEARKKPKVAAFQTAHVPRIVTLEPDLVLGFSDLQADIAAELIRAGANVLVTNQRTLAETRGAIELIGAAVGEPERGRALAADFWSELVAIREQQAGGPRPRVYFEEWDDPLISGIAWVSELIEVAGGDDIFPELRDCKAAPDRVVSPEQVFASQPDIIVASWCGKKARLERIAARPGWNDLPAVRAGQLHEIKAPDILQPGPSLLHGARQLAGIVAEWRAANQPKR